MNMKLIYQFIFLLTIVSFTSCEKNIFGPNKGDIEGFVFDSFNRPIESVSITTVILDSNSQVGVSTSTNQNGSYKLLDVALGSIQISTNKKGYREELTSVVINQENNTARYDFNLEGAPEVLFVVQSETSASINLNDTINFSITTEDMYNSPNADYELVFSSVIKNSNQEIIKVVDVTSSNSQPTQLFNLSIQANEFLMGDYTIEFLAIDKDNISSNIKIARFNVTS